MANDIVNITINFASLTNQNANIIVEPITITLRRGSIIQKESTQPLGIFDAIAGLQYLAGLRVAGLNSGDINPLNMASILPPNLGEKVVKPDIKDVIALMQYLVGLRDSSFQLISH